MNLVNGKITGYHNLDDLRETLDIRKFSEVTIPKGTMIRSTHPKYKGESIPAGRTYKVRVFDLMSGSEEYKGQPQTNPAVEWVGTGSYWYWCDINDIPEVKAKVQP